jgi:adenylosuccinate synthase
MTEIRQTGVNPNRLAIDPDAWVITDEDVDTERQMNLQGKIGSTGSGTGAAVIRRLSRNQRASFAKEVPELAPFLCDTAALLSKELATGKQVIVEGTQGFGLSPLHSRQHPNCTSRDTTAAAFLSEAGLSPLDVAQVVLVIRAHPIRVAGPSGALPNEIDWRTVTQESGSPTPLIEFTSVTQKVRRVARFDAEVVKRAIAHNRPTTIVLNHLDYIDFRCRTEMRLTKRATAFVRTVEVDIGQQIDLVGVGPASLEWRDTVKKRAVNDEY